MARPVSNINIPTDTWAAAIVKVNEIADVMSTNVVTTAANTFGATTTGNAYVTGNFCANIIVANAQLRGGNVSTSANLSISSNTLINANVWFLGATVNSTANVDLNANVRITGATTNVVGTTFNISSNVISTGANITITSTNVTVSSTNLAITSNTTITGNLNVVGRGTIQTLNVTSTSELQGVTRIFANVIPNGNTINFGNTDNRWVVTANLADFSTSVNVGTTLGVAGLSTLQTANITSSAELRGTTQANTLVPFGNTISFGNTTNRWVITANLADFSTSVNVGTTLGVQGLTTLQTANVLGNSEFRANVVPVNNTTSFGNTTARWIVFGNTGSFSSSCNVGTTLGVAGLSTLQTLNVTSTSELQGITRIFANVIPNGNTISFGNTTNRWVVTANLADFSTSVNVGTTLGVQGLTTLQTANVNGNTDFRANVVFHNTATVNSSAIVDLNANVRMTGATTNVVGTTFNISSNVISSGANVSISSTNVAVTSNVTLTGNLNVTGLTTANTLNVTSTSQLQGVTTAFANIIPNSNTINLGASTNRWIVVANSGNFSSTVDVSGLTTLATLNVTSTSQLRGVTTAFANIVPNSNTINLGTSTNRWVIAANSGDFSGSVTVTGNVTTESLIVGGTSNTFDYVPFTNTNLGINTTANVLLQRFPVNPYRSGKITLWFNNSANNSQRSEIWYTTNTTSVDYSVTGTLYNNGTQIVTLLSANLNGANVEIYGRQTTASTYLKGLAELTRG